MNSSLINHITSQSNWAHLPFLRSWSAVCQYLPFLGLNDKYDNNKGKLSVSFYLLESSANFLCWLVLNIVIGAFSFLSLLIMGREVTYSFFIITAARVNYYLLYWLFCLFTMKQYTPIIGLKVTPIFMKSLFLPVYSCPKMFNRYCMSRLNFFMCIIYLKSYTSHKIVFHCNSW